MKTNIKMQIRYLGLTLMSASALVGCSAMDRIENIGEAPEMSTISNPMTQPDYQPVSLPMPAPKESIKQKNSLWASDRQTFFKDQRGSDVGDIITVLIDINDEAQLENETERTRSNSEGANLNSLLGVQNSLNQVLPEDINDPVTGQINPEIVDLGSDSSSNGSGSIEREEEITVRMAALITQLLPNGNMVIYGRQEVGVNFEKRILQINGVIRPQDISIDNTVSYDQIAEARIIYGGEGQLTDVQQPRYGQQLYDVIFPF
jgi:flagellar L-ring protein precursor FlgH